MKQFMWQVDEMFLLNNQERVLEGQKRALN